MSTTQIVALIVAIVIIVAVVLAALMVMRRRALRQRFGPEYDRAVAEADNRSTAEAELRQRERRHAELQLNELTPEAKARYAQEWARVQTRFVEEPAQTVAEADQLMTRLVQERGYPTGDYDEAVAHLSVEHGHTLGHYRDAHDIYLTNERGEATTEQLRQALMHYRAIFADILGEEPVPADVTGTSARAGTVTPPVPATTVPVVAPVEEHTGTAARAGAIPEGTPVEAVVPEPLPDRPFEERTGTAARSGALPIDEDPETITEPPAVTKSRRG